ncbi:hypothetical protein ZWY2020_023676 [Hordeum vulgare]|nr:hypothetical protein ZWY2020_023676 [Hordeum vulgare]
MVAGGAGPVGVHLLPPQQHPDPVTAARRCLVDPHRRHARGSPLLSPAARRKVPRSWRVLVDAHNLLLPYFFPSGHFPGIFISNLGIHDESSFYAAPAPRSEPPWTARDGPIFRRPLFRHDTASLLHYCNGLLLLEDDSKDEYYVCNPATIRCARLPPLSRKLEPFHEGMFLAFDPAVSLHYEVFLLPSGTTIQADVHETIQELRKKEIHADMPTAEDTKDKVISILVSSSHNMQWMSREFVPGHFAPGYLYDMVTARRRHTPGV